MRRFSFLVVGLGLAISACDYTSPTSSRSPSLRSDRQSHHVFRGHVFRGLFAGDSSLSDNKPILYHGGPIIHAQKVAAIYWANRAIFNGGPTPGTHGAGSSDGSLVGYFLSHLGGSPYYGINTSYDSSGVHVQNSVTYTQFWASNTNVPSVGTTDSNPSLDAIESQIELGFSSGALTFDPNTLYLVFTDSMVDQNSLWADSACAAHWVVNWNGNELKFATMMRAIDQHGCRIDTALPGAGSANNDPVADDEVTLIAHETEETNTDPETTAWWDTLYIPPYLHKWENADKCAWQFSPLYYTTGNGAKANVKIGTKDFLIQENWVNASGWLCSLEYVTVSISGPSTITRNGTYTWTASPSGADPSYSTTYQWSVKWLSGPNSGQTWTLGTGQSQDLGLTYPEGTFDMIVTVTNRGYSTTGVKFVYDGF